MSSHNIEIELGKSYWVEFANLRFMVKVIRQSPIGPGWWWCTSEDGEQVNLPETAFVREAE
jgi:hypothetical protein